MSQYGAAGYALHGASYQQILRDYYAQTTLGHVSPNRIVTVLLRASGAARVQRRDHDQGLSLRSSTRSQLQRAGGRRQAASGARPPI